MKKTLLIATLIILLPALCQAKYEKTFSLMQMAFIDYDQSVDLIIKGNSTELNPLLSEKPSRTEFAAFGAAGISAFFLLEKYLPAGTVKNVLLDSVLATEQYNIEENKQVKETGKRTFNTIIIKLKFAF